MTFAEDQASQPRATFIYKGTVIGIPLGDMDTQGSNVIELVRKRYVCWTEAHTSGHMRVGVC